MAVSERIHCPSHYHLFYASLQCILVKWYSVAKLSQISPTKNETFNLGPNWPVGGEIDILEGVHEYTNNQATLHTASGCTLPSGASAQSLAIQGTLIGGSNCAALETGNAGCGVRSTSSNSYGAGFNSVGGGVYASASQAYTDGIYPLNPKFFQ